MFSSYHPENDRNFILYLLPQQASCPGFADGVLTTGKCHDKQSAQNVFFGQIAPNLSNENKNYYIEMCFDIRRQPSPPHSRRPNPWMDLLRWTTHSLR